MLMGTDPVQIKKGRKFDQVLEGARQVFMTDGFEGASVDDIARTAGVSKATLYSYFPDKRLLFMEVATTECQRQADTAVATIDMTKGPASVLREAARHLLTFFLSDFGQQMFRICVAESDRFPDLGRKFYDSGPCVVQSTLTGYFEKAILRGDLVIDDLPLAAHQFAELCKADLFPKVIFGVKSTFAQSEIDRVIDGAVSTFLARYGAAP